MRWLKAFVYSVSKWFRATFVARTQSAQSTVPKEKAMKLPFNLPPMLLRFLLGKTLRDKGSFLDFGGPDVPKIRFREGPGRRTLNTLHKMRFRSRYVPHQGKQECARRHRQLDAGQLNFEPGATGNFKGQLTSSAL